MSQDVIEIIERRIRDCEYELDNASRWLARSRAEVSNAEIQGEQIRMKIAELKGVIRKLAGEKP